MGRRAAIVFGTRPEAIKLAPVAAALRHSPAFEPILISSGQHRDLLDTALAAFGMTPDLDLRLMRDDQAPDEFLARALIALGETFDRLGPDLVIIQGDTTTVLAAALAAFHRRIPVAHVEAGLRTHDFNRPFPEEMNRVLASRLARWHFAPTAGARDNLLGEGIEPTHVHVVGNTVIDALMDMRSRLRSGAVPSPEFLHRLEGPMLLVTTHRRENFGDSLASICDALTALHDRRSDLSIVLPVHLNPNVALVVRERLAGRPRIMLTEPMGYAEFVAAMDRATLILSDSGGIQEEAPALDKPALVMRDVSERPEAVSAGAARLVGTDAGRIVAAVEELLDDHKIYQAMASAHNPFGDGMSAGRIVKVLEREFAKAHVGSAAPTDVKLKTNDGLRSAG